MDMNVDEAICIILTLQHRPQTDMTGELRSIYQRALRVVDTCANECIKAEQVATQTNGHREKGAT